jgi:medium-chain acyl-CoA synthetase
VTGKYWLDLTPGDLHWNIADTGWAKSAWSNVLAPWSMGAGVFVHGMRRFLSDDVFRVLSEKPITTLCAPPTLYRSMVKGDAAAAAYNFKSLRHCVSAGEPLNEEVVHTWEENTGMIIREGYGQTETTLLVANFKGSIKIMFGK